MVNNAGIAQVDPIADVKPEDPRPYPEINIKAFSGIRAAAAKLIQIHHG
jgi:meso-butanediol dehydrogenase/(S,S)-butanediol dehydrogenase/diacetyl reductase